LVEIGDWKYKKPAGVSRRRALVLLEVSLAVYIRPWQSAGMGIP
jgi:hypothetical protein